MPSPLRELHQSRKHEFRRPVSEFQELPQDEVEVQRDQAMAEIVVKYLYPERSGSVILQVPSSEALGVAHAIDEYLAQDAKLQASASAIHADSEGGKVHGH